MEWVSTPDEVELSLLCCWWHRREVKVRRWGDRTSYNRILNIFSAGVTARPASIIVIGHHPFVDCRKTARGGATQRRQVDFSSKKRILSAGPIKTFPELLSGTISYCCFSRSLLKITGGRSKQRINSLKFSQTGSDIVGNRNISDRRGKDCLLSVCKKSCGAKWQKRMGARSAFVPVKEVTQKEMIFWKYDETNWFFCDNPSLSKRMIYCQILYNT